MYATQFVLFDGRKLTNPLLHHSETKLEGLDKFSQLIRKFL